VPKLKSINVSKYKVEKLKYIIYHPDDPDWEPWTLTDDEKMVQFAQDYQYTYFWWLKERCVVRRDREFLDRVWILQNRK
jgi:hypothetical protein